MKVTIAILLSNGYPVPAPFFESYAAIQATILTLVGNALLPQHRRIDRARLLIESNFPVDFARNHAIDFFLDHDDGDCLLFLDADMKHPPDIAHQLVAHEVDVVTGRYATRREPFHTVAMRKTGAGPCDYEAISKLVRPLSGLLTIDAGGAGALLVSRGALLRLREHTGGDYFRYQDGPAGKRSRSEDMWFYEKCREIGIQPYLDADCRCKHLAQFEIDERHTDALLEAHDAAVERMRATAHEEEVTQ